MVLYTSGSTGRPKGVPLVARRPALGGAIACRRGRQIATGFLVAAPLFHMNALGMAKFALAAGATIVLLPQFDARRYVEAIGRFKVTLLTSVPTMLALAVRERRPLRAPISPRSSSCARARRRSHNR